MSLPQRFSAQRSPRADHNTLRIVRAHFGLTQDWLAGFLRVPRAAISMEESQGHGLNPTAYLQLLPFFQQLPPPEGPAPLPPDAPTAAGLAATHPALARRRQALGIESYQLGQQQERLRVRLAQLRLRQQALPALLAALAPAPADERPRRYLDYWATDDPARLREDEAALALLDLRQRVLAFELAEIEKLVG